MSVTERASHCQRCRWVHSHSQVVEAEPKETIRLSRPLLPHIITSVEIAEQLWKFREIRHLIQTRSNISHIPGLTKHS